jgi:hypothetical protein
MTLIKIDSIADRNTAMNGNRIIVGIIDAK